MATVIKEGFEGIFRHRKAIFYEKRIIAPLRRSDRFYYEIRHHSSDFDLPISIEPSVIVNFWGTIELTEPLFVGGLDAVLFLSQEEGEDILSFRSSEEAGKGKKMIVLCGPSAAGKSTLAQWIEEKSAFRRVKSVTTRARRPGEGDLEYDFISHDQWAVYEKEHAFFEKTVYKQDKKGILFATLQQESSSMLFILDRVGIQALRSAFPEANLLVVYVDASPAVLRKRLSARGASDKEIADSLLHRIHVDEQCLYEADLVINMDKQTPSVVSTLWSLLKKRKSFG